jgi:hypothetical protein
MALPTTFGPLTAASMAQLDGNFAAVGALTTLLCTATGTNAIVLTPVANQPTVNGYGLPNPLKFGFVAPAATTGSVTLEVLALGFLPVYVPAGSQATSGTLLSGQYYEVTYTTGASYNSGNGAWVLSSYQPATGVTAVAPATVSGLTISNDPGTPNTKIQVRAVNGCLVSSVGAPIYFTIGSFAIDLTVGTVTSTAGGMDGESRPASGWVYLYAISTGSGAAGLATKTAPQAGLPTLPSGYVYYAYLGAMYCDGSSNLMQTKQLGPDAQYTVVASSNTPTPPVIANGIAGTFSATSPVLAAVSVSTVVPPTASFINILSAVDWQAAGTSDVQIAPNASYAGTNNGPRGTHGFIWPNTNSTQLENTATYMMLESTNIYWASNGAGGALACLGWTDYCSAAA